MLSRKPFRPDNRDTELGSILKDVVAQAAGNDLPALCESTVSDTAFKTHDSHPSAFRKTRVIFAAAAAIVLIGSALAGISVIRRNRFVSSYVEFAAWLLPERSTWVSEALEGNMPASGPTQELLEDLWPSASVF